MSGIHSFRILTLLVLILTSINVFSQIYLDSTASVEERTEDLLQRLSLDQKLQYIGGYNSMFIRSFTNPSVPLIKMSDGPVGVRTWGKSTAYPAGICAAATWDTALISQLGSSMGRDARARSVHILLAPGVNIYRAPMCGRNFEYYGEDPFLAGQTATAFVRGVQSMRVVATVKHFAANNQEWDRNFVSSDMQERTLQEIYLPAFREAVINGDAGAIMTAYNLLNGTYCSHNRHLMSEILKEDWAFNGFVMSDWGATHDGMAAARAGLDIEMPFGSHMNSSNLLPSINNGTLPDAVINDKVRRILRTLFRFHFFDRPQWDSSIPLDDPASAGMSLNVARAGFVLLKNENHILPLDKEEMTRIAVIGPNADQYLAGGGSSWTDPYHFTTVFDAVTELAGPGITVTYDKGLTDDETVFQTSQFYQEAGSTGEGLKAQYFTNQFLSGTAYYTGTDLRPNFDWGSSGPSITGFPTDHFSVRWTGVIRPLESGIHEFIVRSDDGCRLYLNNQQLINQWHDHGATTYRSAILLTAGIEYNITLEYYENAGLAEIRMGWYLPNPDSSLAVIHASAADAAIVCVGFNSNTEGEGFDRTFSLPGSQEILINTIAGVNPRTIVVLNAGGNVATSNWLSNVNGLLHTWYPGQEGGTAVAEILFGMVNPSGKLPATFEKRWEDNPTYYNYYDGNNDKHVVYSEGLYLGYRYYDSQNKEPLFPFGFGLSYTDFEYSNLIISPPVTDDPNEIIVSFDITNTGTHDGAEVAQLYIHQPVSKMERPFKELKGFTKVFLEAGETKNVRIRLDSSSFSYYKQYIDAWGLEYTRFDILVGSSSADIRLTGSVELINPDETSPQVISLSPQDTTSNLGGWITFTMQFDEPVYFNRLRTVTIREYATGKLQETIKYDNIGGAGTRVMTFFNENGLALHTKYYIEVDSGAFLDRSENAFEGILDKDTWSFTITITGTGDVEASQSFFHLYPNPASDRIMMVYRLPAAGAATLNIIDLFGRIVDIKELPADMTGTLEYDCSMLIKGSYFVRLSSPSGIITRMFMKE